MRKNIIKVLDLPSGGLTSALVILSIMFAVGSMIGCAAAGRMNSEGTESLNSYLDGFFDIVLSDERVNPPFISLLWKAVRWPLFAIFLGITPVGLIGIPILCLVRSFLLSFSVASFFQAMGIKGLLFAFSALGVTGLVYIPIFFLFATWSFLNSGVIAGRITGEGKRSAKIKKSDLFYIIICLLFIFLFCFVEYSAGDALLKIAAETIF